jgi:ribulose-5-phosphate 4-epimerase/fuculose-1-phosphate aldolase
MTGCFKRRYAETMDSPAPSTQLIADLVDANRILAVRHDARADRFLMARNMAPGLVTEADILEYEVATGEAVRTDPPRLYLERWIHSEIYKARPDIMAVIHNHSPAVLPFAIARGARLQPVCHMSGFLGSGTPLFEIRDHAGESSDLLIRNRPLGAALAQCLGAARVVLMRGHGCTVVAESVRVAVYRAIYTELNARLQLQASMLGAVQILTPGEADATQATNEGQVERPWNLWRERARAAT